jgi:hypothetical protein
LLGPIHLLGDVILRELLRGFLSALDEALDHNLTPAACNRSRQGAICCRRHTGNAEPVN